MTTPTVTKMVELHLVANGFDGLFSPSECACEIGDLAPCGEIQHDCQAGYKIPCQCGEGCDFDITEEKPSAKGEA